jgi:hypothetical protein
MLKVAPKRASIFTTRLFANFRDSTNGIAETRWQSIQAVTMQQEYRFLSSARKSTSQGRVIRRATLRATPRASYNERIVNTSRRSQPRRPNSIVHSGFIGVSGRIDDQFWASQGSLAWPARDRAHCWQGFHDAGAY